MCEVEVCTVVFLNYHVFFVVRFDYDYSILIEWNKNGTRRGKKIRNG